MTECTCYPGGFTGDTYEGPQEDCPVHGRDVAELAEVIRNEIKRHSVSGTHPFGATEHTIAAAVIASDWLARVRAEERERIAQAIEAKYLGADFGRQYDGRDSPDAALHNAYDEGLQTAAETARTPKPCETCGGRGYVYVGPAEWNQNTRLVDVDAEPCPTCTPNDAAPDPSTDPWADVIKQVHR